MADLILSPDQVELVIATGSKISVRDAGGKLVGYLSPAMNDPHFTEEDIAAAKETLRKPGPRRNFSEIVEKLKSSNLS